MIKLDIINEVVNRTGITKTKAEMAVETVFESMKRALSQGERIELRGFGIFNVRPRKTGIGRNPRTGAELHAETIVALGSPLGRGARARNREWSVPCTTMPVISDLEFDMNPVMSKRALGRPVEVLLVEDNPGDVRLTQEAMKEGRVMVNLTVACDGVEAMDVLNRRGAHEAARRPDLILLDLNLPKKNGREVLLEIKADPELRRIPVIVMTTSKAEQDIYRAYNLNANCYITKPVDLDEFLHVVRSIEDFWLTIVTLPH